MSGARSTTAGAVPSAATISTTSNSKDSDSNEELYPLALLMDELKHDDIANRVEAMKKLDTIALALGPERTRSCVETVWQSRCGCHWDHWRKSSLISESLSGFNSGAPGKEWKYLRRPSRSLISLFSLIRSTMTSSLSTGLAL